MTSGRPGAPGDAMGRGPAPSPLAITWAVTLLLAWPLDAAATEEMTAEAAALAEQTRKALARCLAADPEDPLACRDNLGCAADRDACLVAETFAWEAVGAAAASGLSQAFGGRADGAFVDEAETALRARQRESCASQGGPTAGSRREAEAACLRDKSASRAASLWRVAKSLATSQP